MDATHTLHLCASAILPLVPRESASTTTANVGLVSLWLTLLETIDDTTVHCQTEGVARLDWKLLRVLRPLPTVPIGAKEELTQQQSGERTKGKRLL